MSDQYEDEDSVPDSQLQEPVSIAEAIQGALQRSLQPMQGAAGHDGVMSGEDGGIIVKPCTQAEVDFYQETFTSHRGFLEYMPRFIGTLALGPPLVPLSASLIDTFVEDNTSFDLPKAQGKKIATETAIVLENLEHGLVRANVIDLKLGARLYAPGTAALKAARLDQVAYETTSGSLGFRIAGMKMWNAELEDYDVYDKEYGRSFDKDSVIEGFKTFFEPLKLIPERLDSGRRIIEEILRQIYEIRFALLQRESRFYSSSLLITYESDPETLFKRTDARDAARIMARIEREITKPRSEFSSADNSNSEEDEDTDEFENELDDEDEDEAGDERPMLRLKLIDFAHAAWLPGQGKDENVLTGLENIEVILGQVLDHHFADE